jgi:ribonuclease HII
MAELHERFPEYDFAKHKGYVTAEHAEALRRHGPCDEHRRRYVNVRRALRGDTAMGDNGMTVDMTLETV